MKTDDKIRQYQSNVTGDAIKMSIDDSAKAHLMEVLTKIYADPELAIIREYATNALDSHVEAGETRAIEVTLPTQLAPFLTIRDYGIGLDADGIRDIYSRYGTSTKRESNEAVGMLGIGCKSALAYTDQFTLTGFKDGFRTEVLISRDEDGAGSMTIVDEGLDESYLGNGVKVQIPVKRENDVAYKAAEFFRFWEPGTVLVNGKQPRHIGDKQDGIDQIWLDDRTLLTTETTESLVVMGSVPYPLTDGEPSLFSVQSSIRRFNARIGRYDYGGWNAVCFVDIGEVNFAPSREALMNSKRTKDKMVELRSKIENLRDKAIRDQIAAASDAREAQQLLRKGMSLGFKSDATWQGQKVVLRLKRERPAGIGQYSLPGEWDVNTALKHSFLFAGGNARARKSGERGTELDLETPSLIFVGFDGKDLTNVKRAKLDLWTQQKWPNGDQPTRRMTFVKELSAHEKFWLTGWDIFNWADVAAVELPKTVQADGTTKRLRGSYDIWINGGTESGVPADKIAEHAKTKTLCWVHGNIYVAAHHSAIRSGALDPAKIVVVGLSANRVDKFCRDFPAAKQLDDAAKEAAERWVKQQKPEIVTASRVQVALQHYPMRALDAAKLDDPALKEALRIYGLDTTGYKSGRDKYARWIGSAARDTAKDPKASEAEKALAKYPLLASFGSHSTLNKEHLHLYINAAYAAEKGA